MLCFQLQNMLATSIRTAKYKCKNTSRAQMCHCAVAWDEVEELSAILSKKKRFASHNNVENLEMTYKKKDLDVFYEGIDFDEYCSENPNAQECIDFYEFCKKHPYADGCKEYDV